jgi:hypothetical protein
MKRTIILTVLTGIILACCNTGCREQLQAEPPALEGDDLIIATALRQFMYNHHDRYGYDYKYIFITVLGEDPSRDFMDYFDDLFPQILPGSKMMESRYGYEDLPQTKGVWVRFEAVDFKSVSEQEANVTCQSFGYSMESPTVTYRMQLVDERWTATSVTDVGSERILQ